MENEQFRKDKTNEVDNKLKTLTEKMDETNKKIDEALKPSLANVSWRVEKIDEALKPLDRYKKYTYKLKEKEIGAKFAGLQNSINILVGRYDSFKLKAKTKVGYIDPSSYIVLDNYIARLKHEVNDLKESLTWTDDEAVEVAKFKEKSKQYEFSTRILEEEFNKTLDDAFNDFKKTFKSKYEKIEDNDLKELEDSIRQLKEEVDNFNKSLKK
jgi:hypothetical protein